MTLPPDCPLLALADRRLLSWTALWAIVAGLAYGLVTAIIPNPVFGRSVAPEPFAIWTWLVSAPLMGLVLATYTAPRPSSRIVMLTALTPVEEERVERRSSTVGSLASFGTFLAIGCPLCNKVALLLLGASGAMSVWAPIQPWVAVASLAMLTATVVWRLRLRVGGVACPV